ncbi:hypothetical protein TcWFU_007675 [Taenia crassiceps]|uniref:Uncharacterized protein n=1 Tax=Taenia crassiceps TaxID=6207 RepID=A0ABR4Q770_9CEST
MLGRNRGFCLNDTKEIKDKYHLSIGRDATHMPAMAAMEGMLLTAADIMDVLAVVDVVVAAGAGMVEGAVVVAVVTPVFHACGIVEDGLKPCGI